MRRAALCITASSERQCLLWVKSRPAHVGVMSALPPKADIGTQSRDVRFVPKADIGEAARHVRSGPDSALEIC
jgi:hypothetical protein